MVSCHFWVQKQFERPVCLEAVQRRCAQTFFQFRISKAARFQVWWGRLQSKLATRMGCKLAWQPICCWLLQYVLCNPDLSHGVFQQDFGSEQYWNQIEAVSFVIFSNFYFRLPVNIGHSFDVFHLFLILHLGLTAAHGFVLHIVNCQLVRYECFDPFFQLLFQLLSFLISPVSVELILHVFGGNWNSLYQSHLFW